MLHHLYSKLELRRAIIDTVIQDLLDKIRLSYEKISKVLIQNQYVNYFMLNLVKYITVGVLEVNYYDGDFNADP